LSAKIEQNLSYRKHLNHGKNRFVLHLKIARYKSENNLAGSSKNNYAERLNVDDKVAKSFDILAIRLDVLHNYFDGPTKIIFRSASN